MRTLISEGSSFQKAIITVPTYHGCGNNVVWCVELDCVVQCHDFLCYLVSRFLVLCSVTISCVVLCYMMLHDVTRCGVM